MTEDIQPKFTRRDKDMPLRVAKRIARAGICSRREAETLIEQGEVSVNGETLTSPAVNVVPSDKIMVRGKMLPAEESMRLWRYYKPRGLIVSNQDEKGRATIFDDLPEDMPRVISIGRLDYDSEGLLLLTNDGELARHLELPSTGWLRKYRVRVFGQVDTQKLAELEHGITIDGVHYDQLLARLDKQMPTNAWLTIAIREGKNREIPRVMEHIGYPVSRLIRLSYGPYQLGKMSERDVIEIKQSVLYEQLGLDAPEEDTTAPRKRVAGKLSLYRGVRSERKPQREERPRRDDRDSRPRRDDRDNRPRRDDRDSRPRRDDRRGGNNRNAGPGGRFDNRRSDDRRDSSRGPAGSGSGQKRFGGDKSYGRKDDRPYNRSDDRRGNRDDNRGGKREGSMFGDRRTSRDGGKGFSDRPRSGQRRPKDFSDRSSGRSSDRTSDRSSGRGSSRPSSSRPVRDQKGGHAHHRRPGARHQTRQS
ncbi:MAG: pseudouridine synthase [Candidatus Puniceispirillaceae bacterium]